MDYVTVLLQTTLRTFPPVLLAGLGGMLANRVGILNLGLEGTMLMGAFVGVIVSYFTGSIWLALLAAGVAGAAVGILFSVLTVRFKANATVVGIAVNLFSAGLTTYLLNVLFQVRGSFSDPAIVALPKINLPFLENIPLLGAFHGQAVTVWIALSMIAVMHVVMYHTALGLRIRATGCHPMAVTTAGCKTERIQYGALIFGSFLAGIGGVHLSLGQLTMFTEDMISGRGFIAFAAAIFGKDTPVGTFLGALLFSFADAGTRKIQTLGFPSSLLDTIPYIITVITLWIVAGREYGKKKRHIASMQKNAG